MASSTNYPSASGETAIDGTVPWSNLTNTYADDTSYATGSTTKRSSVKSYRAHVSGFSFSIPTGSTINGITTNITCYGLESANFSLPAFIGMWIRKSDATFGTTNKASSPVQIGTTMQTYSFGGTSDLWGETWAAADINDTDFGVGWQIYFYEGYLTQTYIDYVTITVTYTEASYIKTVNGLAKASVKVVNGLAIASVKTWNGLA